MEFNIYFFIVLVAVIGFYKLDLASELLNLKNLKPQLPDEFKDTFDEEKYEQSQEYTRVRTKFGIINESFSLALFLGFWWLGGFVFLDVWVRGFGMGEVVSGLIYCSVLFLASLILSLPFDIYSTFKIEEEFGFNKTTPSTFITDQVKSLFIAALLGLPLMALLFWIFERMELAWLYGFLIVAAFTIIMTWLAPTFLMPLFNKFQPLEDGELKDAIQKMSKDCGFPVQEVQVMDGSKRSTKSNAFFTGFGKNKKIALFDTLIERHTVPELVGVLAHEIGHYRKRHILQMMLIRMAQMGVTFFLIGLFMKNEGLFAAFGGPTPSVYLSFIFFFLLYQPVSKALSVLMSMFSRKNEFEADAYAAEVTGDADSMVDALKKLSRDNLSNLTPHPFHVFLNYSHPPVLQRIKALRSERQ